MVGHHPWQEVEAEAWVLRREEPHTGDKPFRVHCLSEALVVPSAQQHWHNPPLPLLTATCNCCNCATQPRVANTSGS
jgi:hypothetical protein